MSGFLDGVLRPGDAGRRAIQRELETRRDRWDKPGYLYRGGGDYMLRHGRFYAGRVLPGQYDHLRGERGGCFGNACIACAQDPSLRYVEGVYNTGHSYFTPHAWCIDANDELVEVTYPTKDNEGYVNERRLPIMPCEHWSYWGVIFRPEFVEWFADKYGELCMFDRPAEDANWSRPRTGLDMTQTHDFPILRKLYDPSMVTL